MVMNKVKEKVKVILGKLKMPKISLPKIKKPDIKMPNINLPKITMPKFNIPKINIKKLKAYIAKSIPVIKKMFEILIKIAKGFVSWSRSFFI